MGKIAQIRDGLVNLVANLGTPRDKAASTFYGLPLLSEQEAENAYRGTWLARKVIDIPAMDSCRKWRGWSADQEQITAIEAEEKRLGLQQKLLDALIRARLTGGAALYIGTGNADPTQPLKPESLGKAGIRHLNVLSKRVLQAGELDRDPESPGYGRPAFYTLSSGTAGQLQIHPSRLVILQGAVKPDPELDTGNGNGWGDSVLLAISKAIKDADASAANIASLVFEAKVDVIKIPNFMAQLADPGYEEKVLNRLQLAAMAKGINGTLVMDAEENYDQKQLQFGGLVDLLMGFMQLVSGASDIPMTRLLGQSPGGLNASGESDLRNYYDRISSNQELVLQPALQVLDECLIRSALGRRPAEVFYNWRSLWQTTDKERADIGKTTAETIKTIADTRLIPESVLVQVASNMLTEAGVAPGLEAEMLKYGESTPADGNEQDDDEQRAAAMPVKDAQPRSLYVSRKVVNTDEIEAWANEQGIGELQDDLHVTVAHSRQAFDWIKAGNANDWGSDGKDELVIPEGGPRAIEPLGGMSAVILFASSQLCWRHESIIRAGGSYDWPEYTPHISLTKAAVDLSEVEPYRGRIVLGPEIFEEIRED